VFRINNNLGYLETVDREKKKMITIKHDSVISSQRQRQKKEAEEETGN